MSLETERALSLGQILSGACRAYAADPIRLSALCVLPMLLHAVAVLLAQEAGQAALAVYVPLQIASAVLGIAAAMVAFVLIHGSGGTATGDLKQAVAAVKPRLLVGFLLTVAFTLLTAPVAFLASVGATVGTVFLAGAMMSGKAMLIAVAGGALVVGLLVSWWLVHIWLASLFVPGAVVVEGLGFKAGFLRCWRLARGVKAKVKSTTALSLLTLPAVIAIIVGGVASAAVENAAPVLMATVASTLFAPLGLAGIVLVYRDRVAALEAEAEEG